MSAVTEKTVKNVITFAVNQSDLTAKKVGQKIETSKSDIPDSNGLQWWVRYYPAGYTEEYRNHLSIGVYVNKEVFAKCSVNIPNFNFQRIFHTNHFKANAQRGFPDFASHVALRNYFVNGKLTVTCTMEIKVPVLNFEAPRLYQYCDHVPTDFVLIVGSERIPVHRSLLSLLSADFHEMFTHDAVEAQRGEVTINSDFDYETVKAAVDFCYGKEFEEIKAELTIGILRFADMYNMETITEQLENVPEYQISLDTVCTIALYAYEFLKDDLMGECCKFLKRNLNSIKEFESFTNLPKDFVVHWLKTTFNLKTDLDVVRYAHKNSINFIVAYLEPPYLEPLSLENFCSIVSFAWGCSREDLKTACGKFFNENMADILKMDKFITLPRNEVREVIALSKTFVSPNN